MRTLSPSNGVAVLPQKVNPKAERKEAARVKEEAVARKAAKAKESAAEAVKANKQV